MEVVAILKVIAGVWLRMRAKARQDKRESGGAVESWSIWGFIGHGSGI